MILTLLGGMIIHTQQIQCYQPSVKITETSVFSVQERGRCVIRNLGVKTRKTFVIQDIVSICP